MSEFIAAMGASGNEMTVSEHTSRRVLTGEVEAVRARLVYALESLGYTVVSDNPLQARRARRRNIVAADFTDHPRKLAVGLRQVGASATQVTFDFAVTHGGWVTKGDLLTLEREADAVAALAASTPATGLCLSCGTENGGDARFCRLCGAPNTSGAPAELEVLRLTAATRAGLQEVVCGFIVALFIAAVTLPLILFGRPKLVNVGIILLAIGELVGLGMLLVGAFRIHLALKLKPGGSHALPAAPHGADAAAAAARLTHAQTTALPPSRFSVTEGTTELLGAVPREPVPRESERVRAPRAGRPDTGPIN